LRLQLSYGLFQAMPAFRTLKRDNPSINISHRRMLSLLSRDSYVTHATSPTPWPVKVIQEAWHEATRETPRAQGRAGRVHVLTCPMGRRDYTLPNARSSGFNPLARLRGPARLSAEYPGSAGRVSLW
jgi:hypothetical protein